MRNLLFFLYSRRNLTGVVLGLLGLTAYFAGFLGEGWFFLVVGLYLIGVLITPRDERFELALHAEADAAELKGELEDLVRRVQRRLPKEALDQVVRIKNLIEELLPKLQDLSKGGDPNAYTIRQTVLDYLPATLQNYLNLPPAYAQVHPLKESKTAKQLLVEQLSTLEATLQEIAQSVYAGDAQKILVNGRFLEDRFRKAESFL